MDQQIEDIEFSFSGEQFSNASIIWENGDNLALTLTVTGTNLILSGNVSPSTNVVTTTSFDYVIVVENKIDLSPNCSSLTVTGTITIDPKYELSLVGSNSLLMQEMCENTSISSITFDLLGGDFGYQVDWFNNDGNRLSPQRLKCKPNSKFLNTTSITISGTIDLQNLQTTTPTFIILKHLQSQMIWCGVDIEVLITYLKKK